MTSVKNYNRLIISTLSWLRSEKPPRPLEGVPIAVKDNFCVTGTKTSCCSRILDNFVAPYDATVVERSVTNGAIVVGKTNLDEFGMGSGTIDSYVGPTKNIWRSGIEYDLRDGNDQVVAADTSKLQVYKIVELISSAIYPVFSKNAVSLRT